MWTMTGVGCCARGICRTCSRHGHPGSHSLWLSSFPGHGLAAGRLTQLTGGTRLPWPAELPCVRMLRFVRLAREPRLNPCMDQKGIQTARSLSRTRSEAQADQAEQSGGQVRWVVQAAAARTCLNRTLEFMNSMMSITRTDTCSKADGTNGKREGMRENVQVFHSPHDIH